MTLATLPRSTFRPSPGRARVAVAAAELQHAIDALYEEDREKARQRERARMETAAKTERLVRLGQARAATRALRIEVDRKWFWDFAAEALDTMREAASDARRHGEQMRAQAIESRIDAACTQLDKIQQREANKR